MKGLGSLVLVALAAYVTGKRAGHTEGQLDALGRLSAVYFAGKGERS